MSIDALIMAMGLAIFLPAIAVPGSLDQMVKLTLFLISILIILLNNKYR